MTLNEIISFIIIIDYEGWKKEKRIFNYPAPCWPTCVNYEGPEFKFSGWAAIREGISVNLKNSNEVKEKRVVAEPALSIHQRIKKMEKICVAVRLRPQVSQDSSSSSVGTFWKVEDNRISLHKIHGTPLSASSYAFGASSISLASLF